MSEERVEKLDFPATKQVLAELSSFARNASAAELEAASATARKIVPPAVRQAVNALRNTIGQRIKVRDGGSGLFETLRKTRELRKRFAENMTIGGFPAGERGRIERFLAVGTLRDMYLDYISQVQLDGNRLVAEYVRHTGSLNPAAETGEGNQKPFRTQQLNTREDNVIKIAVTTTYSEEASLIYKDAVADFLALQLTLNVLEAASNYVLANHLTALQPITAIAFPPLPVTAPNVADLILRMKSLEERLALYESLNRKSLATLAIVPRDYYETINLIKDGQNRRLYSGWDEAVPGMQVIEQDINPSAVAVIRPTEFFVGYLSDIILHTDRVSAIAGTFAIDDRNMYYMTAELFIAPSYVPRPGGFSGTGAGIIATLPGALSII